MSPASGPRTSGLLPPQDSLADGVDQPEDEYGDKDEHLDQTERPQLVEDYGPGEDEHRLHVEDHKEQSVDVVADIALAPTGPDRIYAALIGEQLGGRGVGRSQHGGHAQHHHDQDGPEARNGAH